MPRLGWMLAAALGACCFGTSGTFAKALFDAGWTPGAASLARSAVGALALGVPAVLAMRGRWRVVRRSWPAVAAFGAVGVAGSQGGYFVAISRIPVSTALMVEYLAPVLLVAIGAVRARRLPRGGVLAGTVVAVVGLAVVLGPSGGALDPAGLGAAVESMLACAAYYVLAASVELPVAALLGLGFTVATATTGVLGLVGVMPIEVGAWHVRLFGGTVPALVPLAVVTLIATVTAYLLSVSAAPRIGSRAASFVGLTEVLFATLAAAVVLGQVPGPLQAAGGAALLAGVLLVVSVPASAPAVPRRSGDPRRHAVRHGATRRTSPDPS